VELREEVQRGEEKGRIGDEAGLDGEEEKRGWRLDGNFWFRDRY
jgi:hypothetical protein